MQEEHRILLQKTAKEIQITKECPIHGIHLIQKTEMEIIPAIETVIVMVAVPGKRQLTVCANKTAKDQKVSAGGRDCSYSCYCNRWYHLFQE